MLVSLAQALVPPTVRGETVRPWIRAIDADGDLVGFVMMTEPYEGSTEPDLLRFLIDHRHQRRGIGRRALDAIVAERRAAGHTHLRVGYVEDVVGSPARFYEHFGFVPTGRVDDGETEARLELSSSPTDERPGRSVP